MSDEFDEIAADDPELATVDLSNPDSVRRIRDKQRREQEEASSFWRAVFADRVGRREMWSLLQSTHAFEERFACGANGFPQPEHTWFMAGEQAFGMRLYLSWLKITPDGLHEMMSENNPDFAKPKRSTRK